MNNRDRLLDILVGRDMARSEVAQLLSVSLGTVNNWVMTKESGSQEAIPDMAIELLEIKLGIRDVTPYSTSSADE